MAHQTVKFNNAENKQFLPTLKKNIDKYLAEHGSFAKDTPQSYFKVVFWMGAWALTYAMLYTGWFTGPSLFLMGVIHMMTHVFIAFNISHDANHNAISENDAINNLLSYSLDMIGVNSYLWRFGHNQEHHGFVNIEGIDNNIEGFGLVRFSPETPHKPAFKFQKFYAPILYGLSTINYVTRKDFRLALIYKRKGKGLSGMEWAKLIFWKLFYYTYTLVLPILFLPVAWYWVVLCFVVGHIVVGNILSFVFLVGHLTEDAYFPPVSEDGKVDQNWAVHIYETTNDFAIDNHFLTWMVGGINIHVIHHLLPHINHTNYRLLIPVIQDTAKECGIRYNEFPSFTSALISHFRFLDRMGKNPTSTNTAMPNAA